MKIIKSIPLALIFFLLHIQINVYAQKNEQSTFVKGPSDSYGARIRARINPNIIFNGQNIDALAEIEIQCASDGVITNLKLLKSIGSDEWAEATADAIRRTEIIPRDIDGRIHCPLVITFYTTDKMMRDEILKRNLSPADIEKLRAENMKRISEGKETLSLSEAVSQEVITPNISVFTSTPRFPGRPNSSAYQIMKIEGGSSSTQRFSLQIFSDGQAPFVSNGEGKFLMHTGNGVFVDNNTKLLIDEKNSQVSINGLIVKGVKFFKSPPPPSNQTYGEKLRFGGKLSKAVDETDLMAGCSAAATLASNRQWANKSALEDGRLYGACMSAYMASDKNYWQRLSQWRERLKTEDTYVLFLYADRCSKDYTVLSNMKKNSIGEYTKQCSGVLINH